MKFLPNGNVLFDDGEGLYCHAGLLSTDGVSICYGFDGGYELHQVSTKHANEIADHMIELWKELKRTYRDQC